MDAGRLWCTCCARMVGVSVDRCTGGHVRRGAEAACVVGAGGGWGSGGGDVVDGLGLCGALVVDDWRACFAAGDVVELPLDFEAVCTS